jgi:ketosteroid isomerase-like protein
VGYAIGGITMKADAGTEAAVLATLNLFNESYAKRDARRLMDLFVTDPDVLIIGTGADERRIGPADIRALAERDWTQSDAAMFDFQWTAVSSAGAVAWLAAEGVVRATGGGQEQVLPIRLTAVLEQRGDRWLFVQAHASLPASGQAEGQAWPTA